MNSVDGCFCGKKKKKKEKTQKKKFEKKKREKIFEHKKKEQHRKALKQPIIASMLKGAKKAEAGKPFRCCLLGIG